MNMDLIVSWPSHMDYPLFRKFLRENRTKFEKVIAVITDMKTQLEDYIPYIKEVTKLDKISWIINDNVPGDRDWRDVAVNKALTVSESEWVWFTEQDFFPQGSFWKEVDDLASRTEVFGRFQETRLHPCCIFIKRSLLDKTTKNFGVVRDELDHFGKLQRDLENKNVIMGVIFNQFGFHLNGLSQNMYMLQTGLEPNYQPQEFKEYVKKCLDSRMPLHPDFEELFLWYLDK